MFRKFTTILNNAVEALAPTLPLQEDFMHHWKAITNYFLENKDDKRPVEQTNIPEHLEQMLDILVKEESVGERGSTGPCMEYMLHHKLLDTLYTLGRTDCPPGMKQQVLVYFTKLLSRISQPLLPHINVHKPVQRLIRICGEIKAAPTETEEIQFLLTVCAKLTPAPYLVNFFLESPTKKSDSQNKLSKSVSSKNDKQFCLVESLLALCHSADGRVGVKACEGLMLCAGLPEESSALCIVERTPFCKEITNWLIMAYNKLPHTMDPSDIECVEAKWGLDVVTAREDRTSFVGHRQLVSFISLLDYCDQLIHMAHSKIGDTLAKCIREHFLLPVIESALLQTSEPGCITATAHVIRSLRVISSPALFHEYEVFILGDSKEAEVKGQEDYKLRHKLIERCNHLSEELSVITLKLFDTLLQVPSEHTIHNLILRNLENRLYYDVEMENVEQSPLNSPGIGNLAPIRLHEGRFSGNVGNSDTGYQGAIIKNEGIEERTHNNTHESGVNSSHNEPKVLENCSNDVDSAGKSAILENSVVQDNALRVNSETEKNEISENRTEQESETKQQCAMSGTVQETMVQNGLLDVENGSTTVDESDSGITLDNSSSSISTRPRFSSFESEPRSPGFEEEFGSLPTSPTTKKPGVHKIVNCFLNLVPDDAKSSYQMADSGYDTYLRDAHQQFAEMSTHCLPFNWPKGMCSDVLDHSKVFYEGQFLQMLFDKLSHMLDQNYDVNLQVTSVIAKLALLPHPAIHEYLLNPFVPLRQDCRSLFIVFKKLEQDLQNRLRGDPAMNQRLLNVRKQLMGVLKDQRRYDDSHTLEGIIVLEEFCKELAAIAFVKHHAIGPLQ